MTKQKIFGRKENVEQLMFIIYGEKNVNES